MRVTFVFAEFAELGHESTVEQFVVLCEKEFLSSNDFREADEPSGRRCEQISQLSDGIAAVRGKVEELEDENFGVF